MRHVLAALPTDKLLQKGQLKNLEMPIDLIWGQEEKLLPESVFQAFVKVLPDHARVLRPAQMGHTPYLDTPRPFAKLVRNCLTNYL